ncbi:MAG: hypothetical protein J1F23_01925 [Oscillospiraceae bacterium]|nr:hypothetical protein [Oscillospiraceae bacterium]
MKKPIAVLLCITVFLAIFVISYSDFDDFASAPAFDPGFNTNTSDDVENVSTSEPIDNINTPDDFEEKLKYGTFYYYNHLNEQQKNAYREIYKTVVNFDKSCSLSISANELLDIYIAILYDNPDIFWLRLDFQYVDYSSSVQFTPMYRNTKAESEAITKRLNAKIDEIVAKANYNSDYEKELFFHDYVCENTVYDISTLDTVGSTAYSSLLDGKAICEGYSRAMQMLLDRVGIKNYLIIGKGVSDGKSEPHMWNVVIIDGKEYHLDATWDDGDSSSGISHLYFNVTDSDITKNHTDLSPRNNSCVWYDANYFTVNDTYLTSFSGFDALTDICADRVSKGELYAELRFENDGDYKRAFSIMENDKSFFDFIAKVAAKSNKNIKTDTFEYFFNDELNYICIVFKG